MITIHTYCILTLGRTCKFIPPTLVDGWSGWSLPPALEFLICCSISKQFYLQWKAFDLLYKMGGGAAGGL